MQFYPTLEEVQRLTGQGYNIIPVSGDMPADMLTPVSLFLSIREKSGTAFLLESAERGEQWGRYSFVGYNPRVQFIASLNTFKRMEGDKVTTTETANPLEDIRKILSEFKSPQLKEMPKFNGGLIGFFGYDTMRYVEPTLTNTPPDDLGLPDIHLMLCEELIAFDHLKHKMVFIVNMKTDGDIQKAYQEACLRIGAMKAEAGNIFPGAPAAPRACGAIRSNMTQDDFMANVVKAKEYIKAGDIFQVVLSRRQEVDNPPDPFAVYRMIRMSNPSPYMYFYQFPDYCIAGASPELLVSVDNGSVCSRPIAGTIRRGADEEEDLKLENQLLADQKELAEHTMLVDLGRNDIGRISEIGSVEVIRFMAVERYSQLMHIVSDVRGRLKKGLTAVDALAAVLPAGTLSGAPKIRAMEIIDELEPCKRGIYGGAIGYMGFDGNMDTCITIRTVLFANGKAYVQSGGGIVADSDPDKEFWESETKAKAMVKAIMEADTL